MSLPDGAEYWQGVKSSFGRTKRVFVHVPNFDCGHYHVSEAKYLPEVDCHACIQALNEGLEHRLMSAEQLDAKIKNRAQQKANKQKKNLLKKHCNNPVCTCGFPMVSRSNRVNGNKFWGCVQWPNCKETKPM